MIDLLLGKFSTSSMIMGGSFFRMRCCAHILNLIVRDDLFVIQKNKVYYWTSKPARHKTFKAAKK